MTEIDFALNQKQDTEIIELVGTVLWNKANEINGFSYLSQPEQTFVYIDIFEGELINGCVYEFFYNSSGAYAHEVLDAYTAIGAHDTAELVNLIIKTFPELPVPKDIFFRRKLMNQLDTKLDIKWNDIENSLLNSKEDIVALLINYIKKYKTFFEY